MKLRIFSETFPPNSREKVKIVVATGEPIYREKILRKILFDGYSLRTVISKRAYVGMGSEIGDGTIVFPNCYIGCDSKIGKNSVIHTGSVIESDCKIGNHVFISVNAFVGDHVICGDKTFLGPGTLVKDSVKIGDGSVVGMGSVLLENIGDGEVWVGSPAKLKRKNDRPVFWERNNYEA